MLKELKTDIGKMGGKRYNLSLKEFQPSNFLQFLNSAQNGKSSAEGEIFATPMHRILIIHEREASQERTSAAQILYVVYIA